MRLVSAERPILYFALIFTHLEAPPRMKNLDGIFTQIAGRIHCLFFKTSIHRLYNDYR